MSPARKRGTHRRARDAQAVHFVAQHAGDVEAVARAGGVEHGVVAGAAGAVAEVVADQDVARAEALDEDVGDEGFGRLRREGGVEAHHHRLGDAAALELAQLVAQRRDPRRRRLGLPSQPGEVVARIGLEGQHRRRQAAVRGPPTRAARASPGGRDGRRRNCRSSARSGRRGRGAAGCGRRAWREIMGGEAPAAGLLARSS